MEPECRTLTNELIPGVRACLAQQMSRKYGMTQQEIAEKLGIAQVAVSKYLNTKYSNAVARSARTAEKRMSGTDFVKEVMESKDPGEVNRMIERFCEEQIYA